MSAGVDGATKPLGATPGSSRDAATPQQIRRMTGSNGTGARFSEGSLSFVAKFGDFGGMGALVALLTSIDVREFALPSENLHRGSPMSSGAA